MALLRYLNIPTELLSEILSIILLNAFKRLPDRLSSWQMDRGAGIGVHLERTESSAPLPAYLALSISFEWLFWVISFYNKPVILGLQYVLFALILTALWKYKILFDLFWLMKLKGHRGSIQVTLLPPMTRLKLQLNFRTISLRDHLKTSQAVKLDI